MIKATSTVDRVPSGGVQFGRDWAGLFLRGDHAGKVAVCIRQLERSRDKLPPEDQQWLDFLSDLATLIETDVVVPPKSP